MKLKNYLPNEIVCSKVEGVIKTSGTWNPKVNMFATVKFLTIEVSKKVTWNGMNIKI